MTFYEVSRDVRASFFALDADNDTYLTADESTGSDTERRVVQSLEMIDENQDSVIT